MVRSRRRLDWVASHCLTHKFEPEIHPHCMSTARAHRRAQTMVHRKSIIKAAIDRLEGLMAIGESRREAKQAVRASGERVWAFSTGRIHSFKTRSVYQEQILRFINWCRENYQIRGMEELDARADELASQYLTEQMQANKSPYTLQA